MLRVISRRSVQQFSGVAVYSRTSSNVFVNISRSFGTTGKFFPFKKETIPFAIAGTAVLFGLGVLVAGFEASPSLKKLKSRCPLPGGNKERLSRWKDEVSIVLNRKIETRAMTASEVMNSFEIINGYILHMELGMELVQDVKGQFTFALSLFTPTCSEPTRRELAAMAKEYAERIVSHLTIEAAQFKQVQSILNTEPGYVTNFVWVGPPAFLNFELNILRIVCEMEEALCIGDKVTTLIHSLTHIVCQIQVMSKEKVEVLIDRLTPNITALRTGCRTDLKELHDSIVKTRLVAQEIPDVALKAVLQRAIRVAERIEAEWHGTNVQ